MERSVLETLWMWRLAEQIRSRMCPRLWAQTTRGHKLKQLSRSRKSIAFLHSGESMWSLKSQRSKTDCAVMNSERSGMNDGLGLGGGGK